MSPRATSLGLPRSPWRRPIPAVAVGLLLAGSVAGLVGCERRGQRTAPPSSLAVDVLADTGRATRLRIEAPAEPRPTAQEGAVASARVWLARVTPRRAPLEAPLPDPAPAAPESRTAPPSLEVDEGLKPPILRRRGTLIVPPGVRRATLELDVRVAEDGSVSDALWVSGSRDSAAMEAAILCALEMSFYPALQGGRPVAVWCRQRFDLERR